MEKIAITIGLLVVYVLSLGFFWYTHFSYRFEKEKGENGSKAFWKALLATLFMMLNLFSSAMLILFISVLFFHLHRPSNITKIISIGFFGSAVLLLESCLIVFLMRINIKKTKEFFN